MDSLTDQQLLRDYGDSRSETAFVELVRRHVDFVHSAAVRMVCDAHLAEDVTQGVFIALAQNARQLAKHPVLAGWLHRTAQNIAAQTVRTDVRRRAREQEAAAMNETLSAETNLSWQQIAPHLDTALSDLNQEERDVVLLRYFQRKSAEEIAQVLGISSEAAQKRVSRAVERLRELFAKRGVTVGAGGLVAVISANAVQAAPAGLAASISAAAISAVTFAAATLTKSIAMSTFQKALVATAFAAVIGVGMYEAHKASTLESQLATQQQISTERAKETGTNLDKAEAQLADLQAKNNRLKRNAAELLKLRGEVTQLRKRSAELAEMTRKKPSPQTSATNTPTFQTFSSTNNFTVGWGQTTVSGGWETPSGLRAYVFATPKQGNTPSQLAFQIEVAELAVPIPAGITPGTLSGILTADQYAAMLEATKGGASNLHDMQIIVANGQQAIIGIGSGEDDSSQIALTPTISNDGQTVDLEIIPTLSYPLATNNK